MQRDTGLVVSDKWMDEVKRGGGGETRSVTEKIRRVVRKMAAGLFAIATTARLLNLSALDEKIAPWGCNKSWLQLIHLTSRPLGVVNFLGETIVGQQSA